MSSVLERVDGPGDAELISAVRGGDADAYGELFSRHVEAARRLARQLVSAGDADDLVSEAFAKVLVVLQRGGGPDLAFRAYLLTAIRRLHVDRIRANARLVTTDDITAFDPGVPFRDTAVEGFENAAAARAFASLPERWQLVLWHTEVEGQKPAEVAPLLAMSPNSVAALAYRAREGLRQAFLAMHVQAVENDTCAWTHANLGSHVRGGSSRRDAAKVEAHLDECRSCTAIYLELTEVNSNLSGILAPVLLGGAAAAYVGAGSAAVAGKGALVLLLDRARDLVAANAPTSAVAGVAAAAVVGGAVFLSLDDPGGGPGSSTGEPAAATGGPPGGGPDDRDRAGRSPGSGGREQDERRDGPSGARDDGPGAASGSASDEDVTDDRLPLAPASPAPAVPGTPTGPSSPEGPGPDQPGDQLGGQPGDQPDPEGGADLHVTATATESGGGTFRVVVRVTGTGAAGGTLRLSGTGPAAVLTADGRCDLLGVGSGTCRVPAGASAYDFRAVAPAGGTLVFLVRGNGDPDPDPSDNRTSVDLGD